MCETQSLTFPTVPGLPLVCRTLRCSYLHSGARGEHALAQPRERQRQRDRGRPRRALPVLPHCALVAGGRGLCARGGGRGSCGLTAAVHGHGVLGRLLPRGRQAGQVLWPGVRQVSCSCAGRLPA